MEGETLGVGVGEGEGAVGEGVVVGRGAGEDGGQEEQEEQEEKNREGGVRHWYYYYYTVVIFKLSIVQTSCLKYIHTVYHISHLFLRIYGFFLARPTYLLLLIQRPHLFGQVSPEVVHLAVLTVDRHEVKS